MHGPVAQHRLKKSPDGLLGALEHPRYPRRRLPVLSLKIHSESLQFNQVRNASAQFEVSGRRGESESPESGLY